jgi:restriction endonuclease S subunit
LNLYQRQKVFFKLCTNWNNQSGIGVDVLSKIPVPLPGMERQKQIVRRLDKIQTDAQELRRKAAVELEEAKKAIEVMILGAGDNWVVRLPAHRSRS